MFPDTDSFLQLALEGADEVDLRLFAQSSTELDKLLRNLTRRQSGQDAHWTLRGDPVIHVSASPNGVSASALTSVIEDAYAGLVATTSDNPQDWPDSFEASDRMLTRRLLNRLRKAAPVAVEASNATRHVFPIVERVGRSQRPVFAAWSTVEGHLSTLDDSKGANFTLYETPTLNPVRCNIAPERFEEVFPYFRSVVRVYGFIYYRPNGQARTVSEVTRIELLQPPRRELVDFRGRVPGLSQGLSAGEYVRRLRAGGDD